MTRRAGDQLLFHIPRWGLSSLDAAGGEDQGLEAAGYPSSIGRSRIEIDVG